MVSTEYIRQQIGHFRDGIAAYGLGDLYEDELAVFEECLACREGYDPKERLPEAGRRVWVRLADGRRHAGCLSIVEPGTISFGRAEEPAQVVDMVRWYPIPGGA